MAERGEVIAAFARETVLNTGKFNDDCDSIELTEDVNLYILGVDPLTNNLEVCFDVKKQTFYIPLPPRTETNCIAFNAAVRYIREVGCAGPNRYLAMLGVIEIFLDKRLSNECQLFPD